MKERANFWAIRAWVYFTFNFSAPEEFIKYICEKCERPDLYNHFYQKFCDIYDRVGNKAVMNVFYCELSQRYQAALAEYATKVYAPQGLYLTDEDKETLGI